MAVPTAKIGIGDAWRSTSDPLYTDSVNVSPVSAQIPKWTSALKGMYCHCDVSSGEVVLPSATPTLSTITLGIINIPDIGFGEAELLGLKERALVRKGPAIGELEEAPITWSSGASIDHITKRSDDTS